MKAQTQRVGAASVVVLALTAVSAPATSVRDVTLHRGDRFHTPGHGVSCILSYLAKDAVACVQAKHHDLYVRIDRGHVEVRRIFADHEKLLFRTTG
jgi:hypothetical protein